MSTVVNGNIWTGACVNGKVVSGLVKNGAVFYKKQLIDLYKRRVMVGDNLRNKVVYGDFKMGYYVTLMNADEEDSITCNNNHLDTVYEYITSDYCSVDNDMRDSSSNLSLYEYDATNGTEILNNNSLIKNDKDYIVSEIIDNATYRHLFIKDPNIRPIQVGDKLVSGTKLYFVYPDNLVFSSSEYFIIGDIYINSELVMESYDFCSAFYSPSPLVERLYCNGITVFSKTDGILKNNDSFLQIDLGAENSYIVITSVDTFYNKYVFVDITTLGA